MDRRTFIKHSGIAVASLQLAESALVPAGNKLPAWKGFNLLDFFSPDPANSRITTTEDHFRWMQDWGFNFVRLPMAYPSYLNIDRTKDITADDVYKIDPQAVDKIDGIVQLGLKYNMHVCMNLHRAPGFCVNAGFHEPFNLWTDKAAQDAFYFHWNMWAKRYKGIDGMKMSFDLMNEPCTREDMNAQLSKRGPVPGQTYREVAIGASKAIRKENPKRLIIADGNDVGNKVIPELEDLDIAQSCRGYNPAIISHYKAPWVYKDPESLKPPTWPGTMDGKTINRAMLEEFYKPWIELVSKGVGVHCGECGCWNKTPHDVFLAWFGDLLDILHSHKIGFALWEFIGSFGILDSEREDVAYQDWHGHKLDKKLLDLIKKY